jgi:hypothetical protein
MQNKIRHRRTTYGPVNLKQIPQIIGSFIEQFALNDENEENSHPSLT